jgi:beta-glucosidase
VQAYRAEGRHQIGLVVNLEPKYPATTSAADQAATAQADAYMNRQYLDPALLGHYPAEMRDLFDEAWPEWPLADFKLIRQPLDFIGVNYYTRGVARAEQSARPVRAARVRQAHATYTETDWEVYPQGLTDTLLWVKERYGNPPVYITENGAAFCDPAIAANGRLEDPLRVAYLHAHLDAVRAALAQGADIRGYCVWSLLDNFEWSLGYAKRFGIVHVDYATQRRTLKASAEFYREVIASNGACLR